MPDYCQAKASVASGYCMYGYCLVTNTVPNEPAVIIESSVKTFHNRTANTLFHLISPPVPWILSSTGVSVLQITSNKSNLHDFIQEFIATKLHASIIRVCLQSCEPSDTSSYITYHTSADKWLDAELGSDIIHIQGLYHVKRAMHNKFCIALVWFTVTTCSNVTYPNCLHERLRRLCRWPFGSP